MTSGFQSSEPLSLGLSSKNGAHCLHFESSPQRGRLTRTAATATTETRDISPQLRFNSLTLDELSEELDRRTKETQRLQEELENATKQTLERFGSTYCSYSSPEQNHINHIFNLYHSTGDSCQQSVTQPLDSSSQEVALEDIISHREEGLETVIDECLQQLSDLQLHKMHNQPEQETFNVDEALVKMQTKLHTIQMEKDALSDLRLKDSREHVGQMEKMLSMLEELQNIKRAGDQKLQETEDETLALNKKVESLEQDVKDMYSSLLSHEKQCGHNNNNSSMPSPNRAMGSRQLSPAKVTVDFNTDRQKQQEGNLLSVENLKRGECSGLNKQKERMDDLITSICQEMALLTDKLSSSKSNTISLRDKLELLKKLVGSQTSLHQSQVTELKSTLSSHKDKVFCLEQQLLQTQSQLLHAQRETERSSQQAEELQSQLSQQQRCGNQQQCELQEEVQALRGHLEAAREQLCTEREEKTCLQALLEQRALEGRKSQELLEEINKELQFRQQETQQCLARLDEAQERCQTLHAEGDTLRLQLGDREKTIDIVRSQMESSMQMTVKQRRTIESLHQENSLLSNQLNQHKMEIQQLRAELDQHKSQLAAADQERQQLQSSVEEQNQLVFEETLEKQQLKTQLEVQHRQLLTLTEEHKQLQQLHSHKSEEQQGVVLKLQSQLRSTYDELDKVKSTLRTLEGADKNGIQVALDMQEKITARREEVDSLKCKIQHLEEEIEKLQQEKRYQSLEHQRQLQEFNFDREEMKQLGNELEALRSEDKQFMDWNSQLEARIDKVSERCANCQDFIHLLEQKIQRALYCKQMKSSRQQERLASELRSLVRERPGVISENHRPHTDNSFHRRRSAPETQRTSFCTDPANERRAGSRFRRKTCGSKPNILKIDEHLNGRIITKTYSVGWKLSSPATAQLLSLGRRSPVHSLLTSDPNSQH